MYVRNYLIAVALVCALGGLSLAGYIFERYGAAKESGEAYESALRLQLDSMRFADHLKRIFITTDLLFGSLETYMIGPAKAQANSAQEMCSGVYRSLGQSQDKERETLERSHKAMAALLVEIGQMERAAWQPDFASSAEQLARVDNLTAELQEVATTITSLAQARVELALSNRFEEQALLTNAVWVAAFVYVLIALLVLIWASRAVSIPLTDLTKNAKAALSDRANFRPVLRGPTEVRELTEHIGAFVVSLEAEISQTKALFNAIPDTLMVVDKTHGIDFVKPGSNLSSSFDSKNFSNDLAVKMLGNKQYALVRQEILACLHDGELRQFEITLGDAQQARNYEARATAGSSTQAIVLLRDLTEKRQAEQRIAHLAYHDGLTGLLNRAALMQRIDRQMLTKPDEPFALLFIDADRFKAVNDVHGHEAGDQILRHIASVLDNNVRLTDGVARAATFRESARQVPARLGGDEFMLMVIGLADPEETQTVVDRLVGAVTEPLTINSQKIYPSISVGVAFYPEHGTELDQLVNHADLAMFEAKRNGGGGYSLYDSELGESNRRKLTIESKLRQAIANDELFLMYQPKLELATGAVVGAEALVRWRDGDTVVPPDEFIPVAESSGLILPLGELVIRNAARQIHDWRRRGFELDHVAVNVATPQFKGGDFPQIVEKILAEFQLPFDMLNIEITESSIIDDFERTTAQLRELKEQGCLIAMDDFGTGFSSLSYLTQLPLDVLKIDRAFVSGIVGDTQAQAIVLAIVQLSRALGLKVVAEGIEYAEQAELLDQMGCEEAQGYLYSPPLTAELFEEFVWDSVRKGVGSLALPKSRG